MINNNKDNENKDPVEDEDDKKGKDTKEQKEIKVVQEKEKTQVIKESMPKVFTIITQDSLGSGFLYADGGISCSVSDVAILLFFFLEKSNWHKACSLSDIKKNTPFL